MLRTYTYTLHIYMHNYLITKYLLENDRRSVETSFLIRVFYCVKITNIIPFILMTFKFDYTVILIVKITCWFLHNYLLYHWLSMIYLKRQKCLAQSFIRTLISHQMELSTNHHFFWSFFTLNDIICLRLMQKRPSMGEQCSRHLVTPSLVSPRNDVFGTSAKKI